MKEKKSIYINTLDNILYIKRIPQQIILNNNINNYDNYYNNNYNDKIIIIVIK